MKGKNDFEKLREILNRCDDDVISQALNERFEKTMCFKSTADLDDPGPEVEIGTESRVAIDDIFPKEVIIPENNLLPVHFLEEGAMVQRAVARVTLRGGHGGQPEDRGWATGFLVSPSLFMTNNHAIPDEDFARKVSMQFNYQLDFKGNPQPVDQYFPDPDDVFYTNTSLDFTLIRLNESCRPVFHPRPARCEARYLYENDLYCHCPKYPVACTYVPREIPPVRLCTKPGNNWGYIPLEASMHYAVGQHVNIIQHPRGRRKEVALQQNQVTHVFSNVIRYKTDTQPRSSGSPVFNNQWDLIAIHHGAGEYKDGRWLNNQGVRIDKIVNDLKNHFSGTATGKKILTELGI